MATGGGDLVSTNETFWSSWAQLSAVITARKRLGRLPRFIPVPLKVLIPAQHVHHSKSVHAGHHSASRDGLQAHDLLSSLTFIQA